MRAPAMTTSPGTWQCVLQRPWSGSGLSCLRVSESTNSLRAVNAFCESGASMRISYADHAEVLRVDASIGRSEGTIWREPSEQLFAKN